MAITVKDITGGDELCQFVTHCVKNCRERTGGVTPVGGGAEKRMSCSGDIRDGRIVLLQKGDKGCGDVGIELRAGVASQFFNGLPHGKAGAIGAR